MMDPIPFRPRLEIHRHICRGRDLGPIWKGLLPNGQWIPCGALRGWGPQGHGTGVIVFDLAEALTKYFKKLNKIKAVRL